MLFRWMFGLPFAALVTTALFFMMSGMIGQTVEIVPQNDPPRLKILAEPPSEPTAKTRRPPKIEKNPPPIEIQRTPPGRRPAPGPAIPDRGPVDRTPVSPGQFGAPAIAYPPQYPEGCRARGAEGDVVVQFDVTPEGNVVNVRILQSADSCFNRTVRNTLAKWKFPPAAGTARRTGMIERFSFQLVE